MDVVKKLNAYQEKELNIELEKSAGRVIVRVTPVGPGQCGFHVPTLHVDMAEARVMLLF